MPTASRTRQFCPTIGRRSPMRRWYHELTAASHLNGKGAKRHIQRVNEAGWEIFKLNLAAELLPKRIHHAGAEAAPAGRLHDRAAAFCPRQSQALRYGIYRP